MSGSETFRFALSSDFGTTHSIPIQDDITWENLTVLLQEKLKMTKITHLELCEANQTRVGDRINDIDDFHYALRCVGEGMIFKVFGKLAISSGVVVTKKSSKSRLQEGIDSLLLPTTTSSYDPLDDFKRAGSSASSSAASTPRELEPSSSPRDLLITSKKPRQLLSTTLSKSNYHSFSSDISVDKTSLTPKDQVFERSMPSFTSSQNTEESVNHLTPEEENEEEYDEEKDISPNPVSVTNYDEDISPRSNQMSQDLEDEDTIPITNSNFHSQVTTFSDYEMVDSNTTSEISVSLDDQRRIDSSLTSTVGLTSSRDVLQQPIENIEIPSQKVLPQTNPEVLEPNEELSIDNFANHLNLDFSSSLQSILAGLSRLEESIESTTFSSSIPSTTYQSLSSFNVVEEFDLSNPSRPNMASLKTSAELEAERLEQEAKEAERKAFLEEETRKLRESLELERKQRLDSERQQKLHETLPPTRKIDSSPRKEKPSKNLVNIEFTLDSIQHSVSLLDQSEWDVIVNSVALQFNVDPTGISSFILLDEENDEVSGKLNEHMKFWKFFDKYSATSGRHFLVCYDQSLVRKPVVSVDSAIDKTHPANNASLKGFIGEVPQKQYSKLTQDPVVSASPLKQSAKPRDLALVPPIPSVSPEPESRSALDFRLSTDYIDEKNSISIPSNASWNTLTNLLLSKLNISPTQKLTATVAKLSLFDDDGDELVGNIENEENFWKVVNSRYRQNRTIFVVTILCSNLPNSTESSLGESTTIANPTVSIFCRLFDNKSIKENILFPTNSTWEHINSIICSHYHLSNKRISTISLFDNENDEIFSGITDEKKFWKCYKTHYNKQYTEFVFILVDVEAPKKPLLDQTQSRKSSSAPNTIPVQFQRSDQPNSVQRINIPQNCLWSELNSVLLTEYALSPEEYLLDRLELVDSDGDTYGNFSQEQKFWKSVSTTYKKGTNMIYVITFKQKAQPKSQDPIAPTVTLNFRLQSQDPGIVASPISIPENGTWESITQAINQHFHYESESRILRIELVDADGDDLVGQITNEKKFWKVVKTGYTDETVFLLHMKITEQIRPAIAPKVDTPIPVLLKDILFCTSAETFRDKQLVSVEQDLEWDALVELLRKNLHLNPNSELMSLVLIDEEGDEYSELIVDGKTFWKVVQTRYSHSGDLAFKPEMSRKISTNEIKREHLTHTASHSSSKKNMSPQPAPTPKIPLQFRLHNEDSSATTTINIQENALWAEISQSIVQFYNFPEETLITHVDLLDEEGDEITVGINSESKFWKIVKKNQTSRIIFLIWYKLPQIEESSESESNMDDIPLYFRLSTDSITDKGVVEIPFNENWNNILSILIDFFEINPEEQVVECLNLVDDEGDEIFSNIRNESKFWKAVDTKYNSEYMVFVIVLHQLTPTLRYQFQIGKSKVEVGIKENGSWIEICQAIGEELSLSSDSIQSLSLVDSDGDELFSKILDERKFWKAALTKYRSGETTFVVGCTARSTLSTVKAESRILSKESEISAVQRPNPPPTVIIKKTKVQESKSPTPVNDATTTGTKITPPTSSLKQPDPSKFEGRYVSLAFKLSHNSFDDQLIISIPAMGSWEQITGAIVEELPQSSPTIDRLDLLDDQGSVLINNIVSSSKFWKACLEQYKEDRTVFNIHLQGGKKVVTSVKRNASTQGQKSSLSDSSTSKRKTQENTIPNFFAACGDGRHESVAEMILQGIDVNVRDESGLTALHIASIRGQLSVIKLLLEHNSSLTLRDNDGMTPLHFACEGNHTHTARYLIESGADVSLRNNMGLTSLHYIAMSGNMDLSQYISENVVNVATSSGLTLLHLAADQGHLHMIEYLLELNANIHSKDDEGLVPIHMACISDHLDCVKLLIDSGSYWNIRDDEGMSPLLYACKEGNLDVVKYLSNPTVGGNLLARNDRGESCLHLACDSGSLDIVKYLVSKKVDMNARNKRGETPLELASKSGHEDIVNWLEDRGAIMRPETQEEMITRKQIDTKGEKAIRAFEAEEFLNLERS